jgi:hypothetical protein
MSSDLYIDAFNDSSRTYKKGSKIGKLWIGQLGTCSYFGFDLVERIDQWVHRDCLMYGPAKFGLDETGKIYQDKIGCYSEYSDNNHKNCNQPMSEEDVEALVIIFNDLYKHWQHLNSLTDEEFNGLKFGYVRPTPESVLEDIYSGEQIRNALKNSGFVGHYWNIRWD